MSWDIRAGLEADEAFRARVGSALTKAALDIVGEDRETATDVFRQHVHHNKRHKLGVRVLNSRESVISQFVAAVASSVDMTGYTDQSSIDDATINTSIASAWDDIAGVTLDESVSTDS